MKILVLHRYFWPQQYPYAQMLKHITEKLATKHKVSVLTTDSGTPNEKEARKYWSAAKSIDIQALPLNTEKKANIFKKIFNSLYFGLWIIRKLLSAKVDVVMVATTPPIIIAMIVRWISYFRKFKYIYHCQDIHPEAMLLGGNIQKGYMYNILLNIDKKNINAAWKVITLSNDMRKTLENRGCITSHVNIINNFIFEKYKPYSFNSKEKRKCIQFLFAGSLGRLQNLDVLMKSLILLKHRKDVQFIFMGDGFMLNKMIHIKAVNNLSNVVFLGQQNFKKAVNAMQVADIGIVSIGSSIATVAYPSKTMMYLGNGLPILALVDENTEIYDFINNRRIGLAISPDSPELIANSIELLIGALKENPFNKALIRKTAHSYFGKEIILTKFLDLY